MFHKNSRSALCLFVIMFQIFFTVPPKIGLIFPNSMPINTQQFGACYVRAWPMFTTNDIDVLTDDDCTITKYPVSDETTYTKAILFTLDNNTSSCQHITCYTQFRKEMKYITIGKC